MRKMGQIRCKGRLLKFRKANFQLFREIVGGVLWEAALGTRKLNRTGRSLKSSVESKS